MYKYVIASILAASAIGPAHAQDAWQFTGTRIEGLIGYDILQSGDRANDNINTSNNNGDESIEGVLYGVGAGFDIPIGTATLLGFEGEYSDSTGDQGRNERLDLPIRSRIDTDRDLYVGGRLGLVTSPNTLLYVKGGYVNTKILADSADPDDRFELDFEAEGWRAGAGFEFILGPTAFGKLEYRYSNYDKLRFDEADMERDIDLDRHQFVFGIGLRF